MPRPSRVFDRDLIARHLARRPPTADDFVTPLVLEDLALRLIGITRTFEPALIMGPDAGSLPAKGRSGHGDFSYERVSTLVPGGGYPLVDPEALALPRRNYQLIVSILDLQMIDDVPGFLREVRLHLAPDGLFIAAALGGNSLIELRQAFLAADAEMLGGAFARVAPFIPLSDAAGLLQRAGFSLPVADVETHIVRHATPLHLMRELKALGASNPLAERPLRPVSARLLGAASAALAAAAADPDGRVRTTLEIIWLSGWAPHESQQQPLAPGSATTRLAEVLGKDRAGKDGAGKDRAG